MRSRGTWIGLALVPAIAVSGCGASTPTAPAALGTTPATRAAPTSTPTTSPTRTTASADCPEALPKPTELAPVLARGVPSKATLCYSFEPALIRRLDAARTYRALRAVTTKLPKNEILATDSTYGLLTLEYPSGRRAKLIVDGSTTSVIEPDASSPSGDRMLFLRNAYAKAFSPYE